MGDEWTGGVVDRRDDGPPTAEEWRSVTVPGRPAAFAGATEPIAYRVRFGDPRTDGSERALLELRGLYARAEIWLNGERVGTHGPYFVPFRHAFDPEHENELIVVCERPDPPIAVDAVDGVPADLGTPGIWWGVGLEPRPRTVLERLRARPRLTDDGGVVDVEITVDAGEPIDDSITLSVRPEGFRGGATMHRIPIQADAGERVIVSDTIEVRDPSLWWPRGYGSQDRYAIRAKLGEDAITETVGFRTVERDDDGLLVNGRRIRARGFTRLPGGDPIADVDRIVEANGNLVRVRGHVPSAAFFRACDEGGVLVWQDLPADGSPNDASLAHDVDPETTGGDSGPGRAGGEFVDALEKTHGHRPSLAIYGSDDGVAGVVDGLHGSGVLTKFRFRYRTWRSAPDRADTAAVDDAVPENRTLVSSVGPPGTDPDAAALYPGWRYLAADDVDWLASRDPELVRIVGEFGAGSLVADDVDPDHVPGLDASVLEARIGDDADVERSQSYQAETVSTVAEALRRHESATLVASTLRDATPAGGMGVLAADGDEKPAYRAIARAFEPVQAVLDGEPSSGTVGIALCNDSHDELEATVSWAAGDAEGSTDVSVGPLEAAAAGRADVPADASRIELTVELDGRSITNRYDL